jgi:hypothetical protein
MPQERSPRRSAAPVAIALVVAVVLLFASSFGSPGAEMDEGTLVAYPELVAQGLVPGSDFETFYGPGEPYLVAGVFEVFGASVTTERVVGLAFRLAIVLAIFALVLPWGRACAASAGLASALVMMPLGLSALAIFGAIAFGLAGVALLHLAHGRVATGLPSAALAVAAGLACGLAIAFRPDVAVAVALGALPLLWRADRRTLAWFGGSAALGLLPTLIWLAVVGPDDLSRLLDDLTDSREGRRLPLPGPSSADGQVLIAGVLATAGLLVSGFRGWREPDPGAADRSAVLLSLGLFALALLPSAIQRADNAHILPFGCVALAGAAPLLAEELRRRGDGRLRAPVVAAGVIAVLAAGAIAHAAGPTVRDRVLGGGDEAADVEAAGRSFPIVSAAHAEDLNAMLAQLEAASEPGETVFTGPKDLRRTEYADTFVYFMVPELAPASFYTEVNPGTADAPDSGLADELRAADWLLLTDRYEDLDAASADAPLGSDEPNEVVASDFEVIGRSGSYELLARR